jgi:hypothetical protein
VTPARRHPDDELHRIPGVGPSLAGDLRLLGIETVADLRGRDPEQLYRELEERVGHHVDRCVLYVFRSSVYFAGQTQPELELTRWWNWKDGGLAEQKGLVTGARRRAVTRPRRRGATT